MLYSQKEENQRNRGQNGVKDYDNPRDDCGKNRQDRKRSLGKDSDRNIGSDGDDRGKRTQCQFPPKQPPPISGQLFAVAGDQFGVGAVKMPSGGNGESKGNQRNKEGERRISDEQSQNGTAEDRCSEKSRLAVAQIYGGQQKQAEDRAHIEGAFDPCGPAVRNGKPRDQGDDQSDKAEPEYGSEIFDGKGTKRVVAAILSRTGQVVHANAPFSLMSDIIQDRMMTVNDFTFWKNRTEVGTFFL